MKEKDIQYLFGKKIQDIIPKLIEKTKEISPIKAFVFELKIEKEKSILFSRVAEHQIQNLKYAYSGFYHKISDSPIYDGMKTRFTSQKPFDCLYIDKALGFIVVCWYEERKKKECHFIMVGDYETEMKVSVRKSLTYERSKEISLLIYNLNAKAKKE